MSDSTTRPTGMDAADTEALVQAALQIARQERALLDEMAQALERDDVPALKAAARKLCDVKKLLKGKESPSQAEIRKIVREVEEIAKAGCD
jgi:predicted TIM-barrel fold metal-dependent hydrolase